MVNAIQKLSVSKKLLFFTIVPTLTIFIFAYDIISSKNSLLESNKTTHDFVLTSLFLTDVMFELQKEREFDNANTQRKSTSLSSVSLTNQHRITDNLIEEYLEFIASLNSTPKDWQRQNEFERLHNELDQLLDIRLREDDVYGFNLYSNLIESILNIIQSLQTQSDASLLINKISMYSTLLWLQEYTAQERGLINGIFIEEEVNAIQSHTINSIIEKQKQLENYFNSISSLELRQKFNQIIGSPFQKEIDHLKQGIIHHSERNELLNRLQDFFGYGGLIHNFKNYLLRSNQKDLERFNVASQESLKVISSMRNLTGISADDLNHLNALKIIVHKYMDQMSLMQQLKSKGLTIKEIDKQVAVDDTPALAALSALLVGEIKSDPKIWLDKTSQQLELIAELRNQIKASLVQLSHKNIIDAKRHLYQTITLTCVAIIFLMLLAWIILKRLVDDVTDISNEMNSMATSGEYANTLHINGNDEIAIMAKSFNALLHKINDSQAQLFQQKSAMDEHSLVSIADLKGSITYVNEKFCNVSGYSREELIGSNHRLLNSQNQSKGYWKKMYQTCLSGEVWHDEVRNKAKDGRYYWVDTTIVPMYDNNNKLEGYTSIRTDISANKEQEKNLRDAKISAEAATLAKTNFLSTMSHEIRTPMNGVLGMAQLLEDTSLNDEQKDYLDTIIGSGNSLLSIINDILDFSKLDANMAELETITFDLESVCLECMELVAGNSAKGLEFIFDYHPDCPRYFKGDPTRIRQVLLNLLGNAVKFTKHGFVRLGMFLEHNDLGEEHMVLEIQDTGIGLKPDAVKHLFDEFTQADSTTTRKYGGTGLGLAISKKIIELMHAEITVESTYGEGSTFRITGTLPRAKAPSRLKINSIENTKILLVDDNPMNIKILKRQLEHFKAHVELLNNPSDTLNVLDQANKENSPFSIVILAQKMVETDALKIGLDIRNDHTLKNFKLMVFSTSGQKGDSAQFAQAGFDAYLNKFSRLEMLHAMISAIQLHKPNQPIITQRSIEDSLNVKSNDEETFNGSILLVEDVLPNQIIARTFLTRMGLSVEIANNGLEAIEAFKNKTYSLIFMDCRMPVMDGYEATRTIRQFEKDNNKTPIPIIALTANASYDDRALCKEAGMDDVVTKPFKKANLSKCLEEWLVNKS